MPIADSEDQAARRELERVLASRSFARNERLGRFLRFVVERCLEGRNDEIKESVLAVEVFGRSPNHDPRQDSIVRTEASRLRTRLSEYYASEGKDDSVVIELPKGGYVPVMRQVAAPEISGPAPERGHQLRRVWRVAAIACVLVALMAVGWWLVQRRNAPISIAVLPLVNLSPEPNSDYFADGLTGEIIRDLSLIDGIVVRSQTSSFFFKGKPENVREAGRLLNAEYILEGSVMRAGRQLRINVQLVRVRDDFPLWSDRYDRDLTDVFAIQDGISSGIVNSLRLRLGRGRRHYETSVEAYDLYLRARDAQERGLAQLGNDDVAVAAFEQAIAKDSQFAPAYAGLAMARAYRSGLFTLNPEGEIPKMWAATQRALELDPLMSEAHVALAMAYARDARWRESENSFRRALELDPNSSETHQLFALFLLWPLDKTGEAIQELRRAEKVDPLSVRVRDMLAYVLPSVARYDEAGRVCDQLQAEIRTPYCGRVRFLQGRTAEAILYLETLFHGAGFLPSNDVRAFLGYAYAQTGRRDEAEKLAVGTNPLNQAVIFAGLGDKERALEAMERSATAGPFRVGRQLTWPELALIRNDPRMKALRKKVGLPQ